MNATTLNLTIETDQQHGFVFLERISEMSTKSLGKRPELIVKYLWNY